MSSLTTKADYFALSRTEGLPARCPIIDRCERRGHTLALANGWLFDESVALARLKKPVVHVVGDGPYRIGGKNNFIAGGLCPEVQLFESSAISGLTGCPTVKGQYDKFLDEPYQVLETRHFSECLEYLANLSDATEVDEPAKPESRVERNFKWLVDIVIKVGTLIAQFTKH